MSSKVLSFLKRAPLQSLTKATHVDVGYYVSHAIKVDKRHGAIITSRDEEIRKILEINANQVPSEEGVERTFVPIHVEEPFHDSIITKAHKDVDFKEHSHNGPVMKTVIKGKYTINGIDLYPGDWVYVPKNTTYRARMEKDSETKCEYTLSCWFSGE